MERAFLMYFMYWTRSDERDPAMDGDLDGKAAQGAAGEGDSGEQSLAQGHQDAQKDGAQEVTGNADGGAADYQAALKAKAAQIAELQGKVADATKTAEATEDKTWGNAENFSATKGPPVLSPGKNRRGYRLQTS